MKKALLSFFSFLLLSSYVAANDAKPWTFWYWMNGAVTQEGITADLEAMAEIGLEGCYLMPIYGVDKAPELGGTIRQGTPEWWKMVDFSLKEADRLELKIGLHICDGFALAGGPWITPEQSMQMVVSTDTLLSIGNKKGALFEESMLPTHPQGFYADIAAYAIPLKYQPYSSALQPKVECLSGDFAIDAKGRYKAKQPCSFSYTYDEPVTISALQLTTYNNSLQALRMSISYIDELGQKKHLKQLVPPRHGWQNYDSPTTVALPTVTTRQLIFDWTPVGTEKGSEDLDNGKWGPTLKIQEMKVQAEPRIDDWEGKSGRVWRVSSIEQSSTSAEMYVPTEQLIRLTPGSRLPQGDWRIVRIGHTSTLHENATGGDCKGLECDKFSRTATQSQLDHWFGEAFKQCDPAIAKRVLKYMHIDSWECSCQNWSDSITSLHSYENDNPNLNTLNFAQYFAQKRGYDLMPYLPLMVGIPMQDCETSERVLRDIRTTIAQLVDESFYPTLVAEARKQDCKLSAESVAPTMISDGMAHYKHADYPMGEFWLNSPTHDKPNDMLDAISGGHVYGKQIIQAEGFTQLRGLFDETPALLKPLLDKQYCLGINRLFFHVYALNPDPSKKPGMTLNGIGLFFQRTQPWWPEGKSFVDYITRCQRLLQLGRPVVDIAVYTGHEMPRRAILPERLQPLDGYHYDSFNYDALLTHDKNQNPSGYKPQYKVVALPGARKMDPDNQPLTEEAHLALESLKGRGIHILNGAPTIQQLMDLGIEPDAQLPKDIMFAHRALKDCDIYFVSNQQGVERSFEAIFRDHHNRTAVIYDAVQDKYYKAGNTQGLIKLSLPAHGSCFVLFGSAAEQDADPYFNAYIEEIPVKAKSGYKLHFEENNISLQSDTLPDWSQFESDSLRYYSGRVLYSFDFNFKPSKKNKRNVSFSVNTIPVSIPVNARKLSGRITLQFQDLHDVASITLNGKYCGAVWTAPYEVDITDAIQKGKNHLDIWVANSWNNAIIGHDNGHAPFGNIWTNAKYRNPNPKLMPAGLGPMIIKHYE